MKLRKFLCGVTAAVTLVSLSALGAYTAAAEETTVQGEYVTRDDDSTYKCSFIKAGDWACIEDSYIADSVCLKIGVYRKNKENVTEAVIPSYVKYTLDGTEHILPVKGIGASAAGENGFAGNVPTDFSGCVNLKSVTIPDTVEMLGYDAFTGCESLTSIKLPKNMYVRSEINPFVGCIKLKSIEVDPQNDNLYSEDGVLFSKSGSLLVYPAGKTDKTYAIPDNVQSVLWRAFNNSSLTALYVPKGANSSIHSATVYGCPNLTDLYFEGTEEEWNKETHYDENAIFGDDTLKNVTVHFNAKPIDMDPEWKPTEGDPTTSEPTTDEIKFSDEKTGIEATAKDGVLPDGVTFNAKLIGSQPTRYSYNLSFTDAAGNEVQPNGSVTVKIPLPAEFDTAYVYRVEGSKNTLLNSRIESSYVVFTTDHFSEYIITSENLNAPDNTESGSENSSSSDDNNSSNVSDNSNAASSGGTSSDISNSADNSGNTNTTNPSTGIALSVLPVSALICTAVAAAKKRK